MHKNTRKTLWTLRNRIGLGRFGTAAVLAAALVLTASNANAQRLSLTAIEEAGVPSFFSLNFGEMGGISSGNIATSNIELEVDADLGTARFVHYFQNVDALILPGGFNTGALTIEILADSSAGTYDERTGEFATAETYVISFEGDLSAFGFESPVMLESTSNGAVSIDTDSGGRLNLDWFGGGMLANPFDPEAPLAFEYTCEVNAQFTPEPISVVRLVLVPEVAELLLPYGLEQSLTVKLDAAIASINRGNNRAAAGSLNAFTNRINTQAGRFIDMDSATRLIETTDAVIASLDMGKVGRSGGSKRPVGSIR